MACLRTTHAEVLPSTACQLPLKPDVEAPRLQGRALAPFKTTSAAHLGPAIRLQDPQGQTPGSMSQHSALARNKHFQILVLSSCLHQLRACQPSDLQHAAAIGDLSTQRGLIWQLPGHPDPGSISGQRQCTGGIYRSC